MLICIVYYMQSNFTEREIFELSRVQDTYVDFSHMDDFNTAVCTIYKDRGDPDTYNLTTINNTSVKQDTAADGEELPDIPNVHTGLCEEYSDEFSFHYELTVDNEKTMLKLQKQFDLLLDLSLLYRPTDYNLEFTDWTYNLIKYSYSVDYITNMKELIEEIKVIVNTYKDESDIVPDTEEIPKIYRNIPIVYLLLIKSALTSFYNRYNTIDSTGDSKIEKEREDEDDTYNLLQEKLVEENKDKVTEILTLCHLETVRNTVNSVPPYIVYLIELSILDPQLDTIGDLHTHLIKSVPISETIKPQDYTNPDELSNIDDLIQSTPLIYMLFTIQCLVLQKPNKKDHILFRNALPYGTYNEP